MIKNSKTIVRSSGSVKSLYKVATGKQDDGDDEVKEKHKDKHREKHKD